MTHNPTVTSDAATEGKNLLVGAGFVPLKRDGVGAEF